MTCSHAVMNSHSQHIYHSISISTIPPRAHYSIVAQRVADVCDTDNAPSISMRPFLERSDQLFLLRRLSIYTMRGNSRNSFRLLYMNDVAIQLWREMGKVPQIVGSVSQPPPSAILAFGVPYTQRN